MLKSYINNKADFSQFFIAQATHCNTHVDIWRRHRTHTHTRTRTRTRRPEVAVNSRSAFSHPGLSFLQDPPGAVGSFSAPGDQVNRPSWSGTYRSVLFFLHVFLLGFLVVFSPCSQGVCMFSTCSQGVSSTKNPNRKTCKKNRTLLSVPDRDGRFTWSPGTEKLPTAPGGSRRRVDPGWVKGRRRIHGDLRPACASCVTSIYKSVCCSESVVQ